MKNVNLTSLLKAKKKEKVEWFVSKPTISINVKSIDYVKLQEMCEHINMSRRGLFSIIMQDAYAKVFPNKKQKIVTQKTESRLKSGLPKSVTRKKLKK